MSALATVVARGTRAGQPAAASLPIGSLYYVTDENILERTTGAAWQEQAAGLPDSDDSGNSSTALTINFKSRKTCRVKFTLTGSVTLTLSNPVDGGIYVFRIKTGAGSFTVTWPIAVLWPAGVAPVITATASKVDLVVLHYDGTAGKYYGSFNQNY